jgi:NAD(P)H-flavin reductase
VTADRIQAPFGRRAAAVIARERHGAYVLLRCDDPAGPRPRAGQFYMLAATHRWGGGASERPFLPRAFSVFRAPSENAHLEFLLEDVGPGTSRLSELEFGDSMWLLGPLGNGFTPAREGRRPLLVGGGVGIAPLAMLHDELFPAHPEVDPPMLGFRDGEHAAGAALFIEAEIATDDGSGGHHGFVTDLLVRELDADGHAEVFACGPPPMLEAVRAICAGRDVPAQLALESGMACGFGACFGCVVPTVDGYVRICIDGPVLEASSLAVVE